MSGGYAAIRQDPRPLPDILSDEESLSANLYTSFIRNIDQQQFCFSDSGDGAFTDVLFCVGSMKYCADRVILAARSEFYHRLFDKEESLGCEQVKIEAMPSGGQHPIHKISMPDWVTVDSFLPVLEYIYTGVLPLPRNTIIVSKLLKLFHLPSLRAIRLNKSPNSILIKIFLDTTEYYTRFANVRIQLENDEYIDTYQTILASRSDFFGALLHGSRWMLTRDGDGRVLVDLKHIPKSVFVAIDRWLYTDTIEEEDGDLDNLLEYIVDILATANELLIPQVITLCSNILISHMDITNIVSILHISTLYSCSFLKKSALDFICWNIETLIEAKTLDGVEDELIDDLQASLVSLQDNTFPRTRGSDGIYEVAKRRVRDEAEIRKQIRRDEIYALSISPEEVGLMPPPKHTRKDSKFSPVIPFDAIHADDIFELEMDSLSISPKKKTPKKKKYSKFDLSVETSIINARSPRSWSNSPEVYVSG